MSKIFTILVGEKKYPFSDLLSILLTLVEGSPSSMCEIFAVKVNPWGPQTCSPRSVRGSMESSPEILIISRVVSETGPVKTGRNIICRWVPGKVHPLEMIITDPFEKKWFSWTFAGTFTKLKTHQVLLL